MRTGPDPGAVGLQTAAQLRQLFVDKAGVEPSGGNFEILLGVVDADGLLNGTAVDTRPLRDVPNPEQAYLIQPGGNAKLALAALDGHGVYYAAQTLIQLLKRTVSSDSVSLSLATVSDCPDIEERGLWNSPNVAEWGSRGWLHSSPTTAKWPTRAWLRSSATGRTQPTSTPT